MVCSSVRAGLRRKCNVTMGWDSRVFRHGFELIKEGFDSQHNRVKYEMRIDSHLQNRS